MRKKITTQIFSFLCVFVPLEFRMACLVSELVVKIGFERIRKQTKHLNLE